MNKDSSNFDNTQYRARRSKRNSRPPSWLYHSKYDLSIPLFVFTGYAVLDFPFFPPPLSGGGAVGLYGSALRSCASPGFGESGRSQLRFGNVGAIDNAIYQRLAQPGIGITGVQSENSRLMEWLFDLHGASRKRAR